MTLPTFLICGAQKAGTTALYEALQAHPNVCMSRPKETEFFNWRYRRGWEWFSAHFEHYSGETAVGEASSRTMPTAEAPQRIADRLPEVKLIFVLRDPVERAHSAFWYYVTKGILCPGEDFGSFIRNEGHPLRQEIIHYGFYDRHLHRFLSRFDERQCLLLRYRLLQVDAATTIQRICQFIGVAFDQQMLQPPQVNPTRYPASRVMYSVGRALWKPVERLTTVWKPEVLSAVKRTAKRWLLQGERPPMEASDRSYLRRIYGPTTNALERYFGLDLTHWRSGSQ